MKFTFAAPFNRFFQLLGDNIALFASVAFVGMILPSLIINYLLG